MKNVKNFSVEEYDATFKTVGKAPYWFTLSGGEPFLRADIVDICKVIYKDCKPGIINIPTNASLVDFVPQAIEEICKSCPETQIAINISLDAVGPRHDQVRGFPGNFEKAIRTYRSLRELDCKNLTVGIHTVISKFNLEDLPELADFSREVRPDSYITEIAEERMELDTIGSPITPSISEYSQALDYLIGKMNEMNFQKVGEFARAFRLKYYDLVKQTLISKAQVTPCYAGWASCQISPDGDVWPCCIRSDPLGNLRKEEYDFPKIWFNKEIKKVRRSIRNKECYCTLANVSYTNMLLSPRALLKVARKLSSSATGRRSEIIPNPKETLNPSLNISRTVEFLTICRKELLKGKKFMSGEIIKVDSRIKCLCGKRICVQKGYPLPTCEQCGGKDGWLLELVLD